MRKATAVVILILFSISDVRHVVSLMQESLGKFLGSFAALKQVKIPDLLNQLCNNSQANTTLRDACYGCFYRTSILPQGYPMLIAMSACANTYLNNTSYGHCQSYLRNATTIAPNPRVSPTIIYCTFLECVRQVNKDRLDIDVRSGLRRLLRGVASRIERERPFIFNKVRVPNNYVCLRECVREAMGMIPRFNSTDMQLAQLYVNTTACVLAKTRCPYMNPVTGALQGDDIVNKLHLPSVNAILVNTDYDFNIIQLPFRHSSVDVCSKYRNVQQATWPSVVC